MWPENASEIVTGQVAVDHAREVERLRNALRNISGTARVGMEFCPGERAATFLGGIKDMADEALEGR